MTARPSLAYRGLGLVVAGLRRTLGWRVVVHGGSNLPRRGGVVLAWLHHGHLDLVTIAEALLRTTGRPLRPLAATELWDRPHVRPVLRIARAVPVDREDDGGRDRALQHAGASVDAGHVVALAPEGRIATSFDVEPFRTGVARLAAATGAPVVVATAWGVHRAVTTGRPLDVSRARGLPVSIGFSPPVRIGPGADPVAATRRLEQVGRALLHPLQEAYDDGTPSGAWWVPRRLGGSAPPPPDGPYRPVAGSGHDPPNGGAHHV